jgi:hypothetical protein
MIWSFFASRTFRKCQRQWCFNKLVANANAKNPLQHEAYLLSKLQTVAAWRGSIVDLAITKRLIPALANGWPLSLSKTLGYARSVFDSQLTFAMKNRMREPGVSATKAGDQYAALYAIEYEQTIDDKDISQAWRDVEDALRNVFAMRDLHIILREATKLMPQRPITFPHFGFTVKAVPDLVAFFDGAPPLIVDWKVHTFGSQDYRLQLALYAVALTRCKPHSDFPPELSRYGSTDIRLLEAQLLTNQQRQYKLTQDDIDDIDNYIAESSIEMTLASDGPSQKAVDPFAFPVTDYPETCERCMFRKLCWEEPCQESRQMTFL